MCVSFLLHQCNTRRYAANWIYLQINVGTLTHWGRVTHICVSKMTTIGSDNGLSPGRRQAIIWTNARILLIGPLGTNFSKILIEILTFSFKKMRLKVLSAKLRPFCLGLNVLSGVLWYITVAYVGIFPLALAINFGWASCLKCVNKLEANLEANDANELKW